MMKKYEEIERTKEINKLFNIQNMEQITKLYSKSDVILIGDIFLDFYKSIL